MRLTSLAPSVDGGGDREKVGEAEPGDVASPFWFEFGSGTVRSRGKVGVAATIPISGTSATLKAAGSRALETAASFIDTALILEADDTAFGA